MSAALVEAARKALDALEQLQGGCTDSSDGTVEAITVWCPEIVEELRAALAQAEAAQPVARVAKFVGATRIEAECLPHNGALMKIGDALYAAPQPAEAAHRQPLTRDQIDALEAGCGHTTLAWDTRVSLVRATERAHGIGPAWTPKTPGQIAQEARDAVDARWCAEQRSKDQS